MRAQVSLEGARPGVRLAAYPAEVWPAVVVAATYGVDAGRDGRHRAGGADADRRVFTAGELQPMMRLGVRMGVAAAAGDQAIGGGRRGRIYPRLRRRLHRIVLRGGTQERLHAPRRRIALLVPGHTHTRVYICMKIYAHVCDGEGQGSNNCTLCTTVARGREQDGRERRGMNISMEAVEKARGGRGIDAGAGNCERANFSLVEQGRGFRLFLSKLAILFRDEMGCSASG